MNGPSPLPERGAEEPAVAVPNPRQPGVFLRLVAPREPDLVWQLLQRVHSNRGFLTRNTLILICLGVGSALTIQAGGFGPSMLFVYLLLLVAQWWWNLDPQMRFTALVRRRGWGENLLTAPVPPSAYVSSFLRVFIAATLHVLVIHLVFWVACVCAIDNFHSVFRNWRNFFDFLRFLFYTHGCVILGWWAMYWCSISGPRFLFMPGAYFLYLILAFSGFFPNPLARRSYMFAFLWVSMTLAMLAGLAGLIHCRLHYATRLRKALFP